MIRVVSLEDHLRCIPELLPKDPLCGPTDPRRRIVGPKAQWGRFSKACALVFVGFSRWDVEVEGLVVFEESFMTFGFLVWADGRAFQTLEIHTSIIMKDTCHVVPSVVIHQPHHNFGMRATVFPYSSIYKYSTLSSFFTFHILNSFCISACYFLRDIRFVVLLFMPQISRFV